MVLGHSAHLGLQVPHSASFCLVANSSSSRRGRITRSSSRCMLMIRNSCACNNVLIGFCFVLASDKCAVCCLVYIGMDVWLCFTPFIFVLLKFLFWSTWCTQEL
uniref:Uncharacterized protein n=1 Tax=Arundo donax TaxID=35708 RepID=A0A0A9EVW4_ARUDO